LLETNLVEVSMLQSILQLWHLLETNFFTEREIYIYASVDITTSSFAGNEFYSSGREVSMPQSAL
jgi:hypothetical protein